MLIRDGEILVCQSLSVDKSHLTLRALTDALFYDLETANGFRIPRQPQRRERALRDLIQKRQKPIALFIDDAHDVPIKTLVALKRLIEVVRDDSGTLSAVLAGQPKLKNALRSPALEAVGAPAAIFDLEGLGGETLRYLRWLLTECLDSQTEIDTVLTEEAMLFLGGKSSTPLRLEAYLARSFEEGVRCRIIWFFLRFGAVGEKPVPSVFANARVFYSIRL